MSNENLRIWDALRRTNPAHTKPFQRAGGFRGTAIKPIYMTQKMTELFGPCGTGWGMEKPDFTTLPVADEVLVFCTVGLWYKPNADEIGRTAEVWGVGGDKVVVKRNDGRLIADDEAYKKAYTDALSNAMKQIGVGADVHMGQFEDAKYLDELKREFAETPDEAPAIEAIKKEARGRWSVATSKEDIDAVWRGLQPEIRKLSQEGKAEMVKFFSDRAAEFKKDAA